MHARKGDDWIPLWVDKWLFGTTRHELTCEQRAIWIDLLCLAAKDRGHIRAGPSTPYPVQQLAGLLCCDIIQIEGTIKACMDSGKLKYNFNKTLEVINWDKYELSIRHKRRMAAVADAMSTKSATETKLRTPLGVEERRGEENRAEKSREDKERGASETSPPRHPEKKTTNPNISLYVNWFCHAYQHKFNTTYKVSAKKDIGQVNNFLGKRENDAKLISLLTTSIFWFREPISEHDDDWLAKAQTQTWDMGWLVSQYNRISQLVQKSGAEKWQKKAEQIFQRLKKESGATKSGS